MQPITIDFLESLSLSEKIDCLPGKLSLTRTEGDPWGFQQDGKTMFTQRITETLDCFIDRVLLDICNGYQGESLARSANTALSSIMAIPSSYTSEGIANYKL